MFGFYDDGVSRDDNATELDQLADVRFSLRADLAVVRGVVRRRFVGERAGPDEQDWKANDEGDKAEEADTLAIRFRRHLSIGVSRPRYRF